ncbi:UPF0016-domain-containing protein [Ascodesmis nigricans]|uniref:UPF0016-domain-containing protein n=1 Tax=Ascodesmis nigricans TaxID=341454 RepID=A0A4S2N6Z0_9PEZI|nr:UPF0016-domain-containing protein [Ascodesmis nigricans]
MRISTDRAVPLLLLLSAATAIANPSPAPPFSDSSRSSIDRPSKPYPSPLRTLKDTTGSKKDPITGTTHKKPATGEVDSPVDGLDGKPHDGPGIFETKEKGSGDVGISGGALHVDLKNPPPHTGDHEIVDLPDIDEGDTKSKHKDGDESEDSMEEKKPPSGPVPDHGHGEYVPSGKDTLKDPPVNTPAHLAQKPGADDSSISAPMHSFVLSFVMILFSEIGDKTFLIAALMAMKHSRLLVFSAALSSLVVMSILSAVLGHAVPTLIPKDLTSFLAGGLFLVFGIRMLREGLAMEKGFGNVQAEISEVEAELQEKTRDRSSSLAAKMEGGLLPRSSHPGIRRNTSSPSLSDSDEDDYAQARNGGNGGKGERKVGFLEGVGNLAGLLLSPAWVQTFVMTFLGEWGDRSQIATIAMAAGQDYWYVTIGAISGHAICTGVAVIGGRLLASRISVRNVTLGGAGAFLVFGILYLGEALYR